MNERKNEQANEQTSFYNNPDFLDDFSVNIRNADIS